MTLPLILSPDVAAARAAGGPIVALESTIITHGMPFPQNVETARRVEAEVRAHGAVPATIAILAGQIHVGLTEDELDGLGQAKGVAKLSRADLAACLATGGTGATTVAATMICAHLAGIQVFATGGIGGVHRGAETSFDISADLRELAETPVTVIAAGAKAILDLPKTLEYLETLGVPVIAYGQDDFPAFWSRSSGLKAPLRMDTARDIAAAQTLRRAFTEGQQGCGHRRDAVLVHPRRQGGGHGQAVEAHDGGRLELGHRSEQVGQHTIEPGGSTAVLVGHAHDCVGHRTPPRLGGRTRPCTPHRRDERVP